MTIDPSMTAVLSEREEIAAIVDPLFPVFVKCVAKLEAVEEPDVLQRCQLRENRQGRDEALAKADRILALRSSPSSGDGEAGSKRSLVGTALYEVVERAWENVNRDNAVRVMIASADLRLMLEALDAPRPPEAEGAVPIPIPQLIEDLASIRADQWIEERCQWGAKALAALSASPGGQWRGEGDSSSQGAVDGRGALPTPPESQRSDGGVKRTMTLTLTDAEMAALEELAAKKDLPRDRIFHQALKLYQLEARGHVRLVSAEGDPGRPVPPHGSGP